MGLYLMQVLDANGRTWLDPVLKPLERLTYRLMGVRAGAGTGLAAIHLGHAAVQPGELRVHLRHPAPAKSSAAQSAGTSARSPRISRSTPPSASPPTPTGRATAANPRCPTSRRWSRWPSTTSPPPPPASPSPRRSCAASPGIPRGCSATSGWTSCASLTTCCCPSAWCSPSSSCRRASSRISSPTPRRSCSSR